MKYHLKNLVYDKVKASGAMTDSELLNELGKNGNKPSESMLNKILLQLATAGLITVRWVGKEKRRIELKSSPTQEQQDSNH